MNWLEDKQVLFRFFDKIKIDSIDKCWEWQNGGTNDGYGHFHVSYQVKPRMQRAPRVSWQIFNNTYLDINPKMGVMHTCDNPKCVNPHHLIYDSLLNNNLDKINKGRGKELGGKAAQKHLSGVFVVENKEKIVYGKTRAHFCRENNLHIGHFNGMCNGKQQQHKGWKLLEDCDLLLKAEKLNPCTYIEKKK